MSNLPKHRVGKQFGVRQLSKVTAALSFLFLLGYIFTDSARSELVSRQLFVSPLLNIESVHDDHYTGKEPGISFKGFKNYRKSAFAFMRGQVADVAAKLKETKIADRDEFNVLVMGGSVSWGSKLANRTDSYASVLRDQLCADSEKSCNVDNLAIRASGTTIPNLCFRSLLSNPRGFVGPEATSHPDRRYDVIVLEFSINGVQKLYELVSLLMDRYPQALIIYIDLHSTQNFKVRSKINQYNNIVGPSINSRSLNKDQLQPKYIAFPFVSSAEEELMYFAYDRHHLNEVGHTYIARKILETIDEAELPENPQVGPWPSKNECTSWYMTGEDTGNVTVSGGTMAMFDPRNSKFAYDMPEGATLMFPPRDEPVDVQLFVMAVGDGKYPGATLTLDGNFEDAVDYKANTEYEGHVLHLIDAGRLPASENSAPLKIEINHMRESEIWPFRLVGYATIPKTPRNV